jgi:hypothetical protein
MECSRGLEAILNVCCNYIWRKSQFIRHHETPTIVYGPKQNWMSFKQQLICTVWLSLSSPGFVAYWTQMFFFSFLEDTVAIGQKLPSS